MKVPKGSLVIMKGVRKNGLYSLIGNTVIGSTTNVSNSSVNKTFL